MEITKEDWGPGPWQDEPDRLEWRYKGFPCLLRRGPFSGAWCGYVGLPSGHPCYGLVYDDVMVDVHGGLTYSSECDGDEVNGICHVPLPGEEDSVWWLGFDCHHYLDVGPAMDAYMGKLGVPDFPAVLEMPKTYKTIEYAKAETEALADQLDSLWK